MRRIEMGVFVLLVAVIVGWAWSHTPSALQQVLFRAELRAALVSHPYDATFTDLSTGADQFEYRLLRGLADRIGARLRVYTVPGPAEAHRLLQAQRVDLAAGFLLPPGDEPGIETGPVVLPVRTHLVYWYGKGRNIAALTELDETTRIGATSDPWFPGMFQEPGMAGDAQPRPELTRFAGAPELMAALESGRVDYALFSSIEVSRLQRLQPQIRTAIEFPDRLSVVWLFPAGFDQSLRTAASEYLDKLRSGREFDLLVDRYFGHLDVHDVVDVITFSRTVAARLEDLQPLFVKVAHQHGLDWRFLAAVSYQESLWNPGAVSPTGVRGLMMLTEGTADLLRIDDRTDPLQSLEGGARYVLQMFERLPAEITEPDRTWMALAAYNVGLGHLLDARRLAEAGGDDPNLWLDVMAWLPKLAQQEWHEQTRHGYARGWEPVAYVQNIRSYYDWLVHLYPAPGDRIHGPPVYLNAPLAL